MSPLPHVVRVLASSLFALVVAVPASADIVGFSETFATNSANWRNATGVTALSWFANGGPLNSTYASSLFNLSTTTAGGFPATVIRAHASYPSSAGAYVGNWITAGVTEVSFDFRHNLSESIVITGRFASAANFPGASTVSSFAVASGVWTRVSYNLTAGSSDIVSFGGGTYESVFSSIGNMQFGFNVPATLAGQNIDGTFDIANFQIIPAPSAISMLMVAGLSRARRRR